MAGPLAGEIVPLLAGQVRVGRDGANDVVLADSAVAAFHCVFSSDGDRVSIVACDRENPTFVNGLPPVLDAPLEDGQRVLIGTSLFVFRSDAADEPAADEHVRIESGGDVAAPALVMTREE